MTKLQTVIISLARGMKALGRSLRRMLGWYMVGISSDSSLLLPRGSDTIVPRSRGIRLQS